MGKGWLADLGVVDFAGGVVIHTIPGMGAIAAQPVLGRRKNFGKSIMVAHNIPLAVIGAGAMLWFGWFGFNAGSALSAGSLAGNTLFSIAGCICHVSYGLDRIIVEEQGREAKCHSGYYRCNSRIGRGNSSFRIYQCTSSNSILGIVLGFSILLYGLASQAADYI